MRFLFSHDFSRLIRNCARTDVFAQTSKQKRSVLHYPENPQNLYFIDRNLFHEGFLPKDEVIHEAGIALISPIILKILRFKRRVTMRAHAQLDPTTKKQILTTVILAAGLALAGVWTNTVGYSIDLLPLAAEPIIGFLSADAFRLGRLFMGIVFIVCARKLPQIQKTTVIIATLILSMGTGSLIIAYNQTLLNPLFLSVLSIFISIACYSFLVWVFYRQFARRLPTIYAVWGIAASLILEIWLSAFTCLVLPAKAQITLSLFLPFFIAAAYYLAFRFNNSGSEPKPLPRISKKSERYSLIAQVIIITVALVFIQALSEAGTWGESRGTYAEMTYFDPLQLSIVTVLVLVLTFLIFHLPRIRLSLSLRCIIGFSVLLLGLQILALTNDLEVDSHLVSIAVGIESFSHLVRWLMVIECVRMISMPSYRVAGIAHVASALVGLFWTHFASEISLGNSALVMVTIYLLLMSVIIIFVRGYYSHSTRLWATETTHNNNSTKEFIESYSLSPREGEVFSLLMQGYKYTEIEQSCALSSGTVKTHVSNLYKKLDVHSRQEMRERYEQYRTEKSLDSQT